MRMRAALPLLLAAALAAPAQFLAPETAIAQTETPPGMSLDGSNGAATAPQPTLPSSTTGPNDVSLDIGYEPLAGAPTFHGSCACPSDVHQGMLNDCYLLAAFAAVAQASPGTILQDFSQANVPYTVKLWDAGSAKPAPAAAGHWGEYTVDNMFPAFQAHPGANGLMSELAKATTYLEAAYFSRSLAVDPAQSFVFAYRLQATDPLWPMVMEKAYALQHNEQGGYSSMMKGGTADGPLQAVTGVATTTWYVSDEPVPRAVITSATVVDMPSAPDAGEHSIFRHPLNWEAIAPDIQVCVTAKGSTPSRGPCTNVCQHARNHSCTVQFPYDLAPDPKNPAASFEILDPGRLENVRKVAAASLADPTDCTASSPCQLQPMNSIGANTVPIKLSFGLKRTQPAKTLTTLLGLDKIFRGFQNGQGITKAVVLGSKLSDYCVNDLKLPGVNHAFYFRGYGQFSQTPWKSLPVFASENDLIANQKDLNNQVGVILGNPQASGLQGFMSLKDFLQCFIRIDVSGVTQVPLANCSCSK